MVRFVRVLKQRNFKRGRTVLNIKSNKKIKVIGIGKLTAIEVTKTGKLRFISSKNLRIKRRKK